MEVNCGPSHENAKHATRYKIVYGLMDGQKNKNCSVTCDNFFSSPTLFWDLFKVVVHATNTCRIDRKGCLSALTIDPKKGSRRQLWYHMHASSKLRTISQFDHKLVFILFVAFSPIGHSCATFAIRWHLTSPLETPFSQMLVHYHEHLRGVDVQDQLYGYYTLQSVNEFFYSR